MEMDNADMNGPLMVFPCKGIFTGGMQSACTQVQFMADVAERAICDESRSGRSINDVIKDPIDVYKYGDGSYQPYNYGSYQVPPAVLPGDR
jgi:hypothetical protein